MSPNMWSVKVSISALPEWINKGFTPASYFFIVFVYLPPFLFGFGLVNTQQLSLFTGVFCACWRGCLRSPLAHARPRKSTAPNTRTCIKGSCCLCKICLTASNQTWKCSLQIWFFPEKKTQTTVHHYIFFFSFQHTFSWLFFVFCFGFFHWK